MTNLTRTIGVEMEFIAPRGLGRSGVAARLSAAGVDTYDAGYTHETTRRWKLVSDASVTGMGEGMELVSPVLRTEEDLAKLEIACATLQAAGCVVNKRCGLHVHVGAREMTVNGMRRLAAIYADFEAVIDSLMPSSRRASNNSYCGSIANLNKAALARATDARAIADVVSRGNRFVKLNYTSFWKHGTIEFRQHAGTLQFPKIKHWALTCVRLIEAAEREGSTMQAATTIAVRQARPRQAVLARLYDLCARPEGVTREEARIALGRRSPPNMQRLTEDSGVQIVRRGERYYLAPTAAPATVEQAAQPQEVISLEGFCAKLAMTEEEKQFWQERQRFFAADRSNDTVGLAPGSLAYIRAQRGRR